MLIICQLSLRVLAPISLKSQQRLLLSNNYFNITLQLIIKIDNLLDLVFPNSYYLEVTKCSFLLVSIDIVHTPLQINGPIVASYRSLTTQPPEYNFYAANYEAMNAHLSVIDSDSLLNDTLDLSVIISIFYSNISNTISIFTLQFGKRNT